MEHEFLPTPESISKYVKENAQAILKSSGMKAMMHHQGGQEILREDDYKGHHIAVRTRYDITVDGQVVTGHIMLTNAGEVQYHGLPNYSFDSAIELARALVDNFPQDFEKTSPESGSHEGMDMGMAGMGPEKKKAVGKKKSASSRRKKSPGKS